MRTVCPIAHTVMRKTGCFFFVTAVIASVLYQYVSVLFSITEEGEAHLLCAE